MLKKMLSEFLGTAALVFFGCGTAVFVGADDKTGLLITALAFGLTIIATAYLLGEISGCHLNPAVSLAMLICDKMNFNEFVQYVLAQIAGAFAGSGCLYAVISFYSLPFGLGANTPGNSTAGALIVEGILTMVFVLSVLGVTENPKFSAVAPLAIGFTLTMVHIIGINFTGTSVNPARSIAPAVLTGGVALDNLWIFIVAPLAGAATAAILFRIFKAEDKTE